MEQSGRGSRKERTPKNRSRRAVHQLERRLAQLLVFSMLVMLFQGILPGAAASVASENAATPSNAERSVYVAKEQKPVTISIISDAGSYQAGDQVCLEVYVKNNTDQVITDGTLHYSGKGIDPETVYFEQLEENGEEAPDPQEEASDTELLEENGTLTGLQLNPGQCFHTGFYFTIDEDAKELKTQKLKFRFTGVTEPESEELAAGMRIREEELFLYTVGGLNLNPIWINGSSNEIKTGTSCEMAVEFDTGDVEDMLEEEDENREENLDPETASPSQLQKPGGSGGGIALSGELTSALASPSDAVRGTEKALVRDLNCRTETYGITLKGFSMEQPYEEDASFLAGFRVESGTKPGVYFGKITSSYKIKGRTCQSTQGIRFVVTGEGELELKGQLGAHRILVTGPASSFPEAEELVLQVREPDQEQIKQIDEALQKKEEEEGKRVESYRAFELKLFADGVEVEPEGPIRVVFKDAAKQKEQKQAEQEQAEPMREEQHAAESVLETTVFHLDETTAEAHDTENQVTSEGDVILDTDHFSVYLIVNLESDLSGTAILTIQHYGTIKELKTVPDTNIATNGGKLEYQAPAYQQIYLPDSLELKNYTRVSLDTLNKLKAAAENGSSRYRVEGIWLWKGTGEPGDGKPAAPDWVELTDEPEYELKKDTLIRVDYLPDEAQEKAVGTTVFYDYDVNTSYSGPGSDRKINSYSNFSPATTRYLSMGNYGTYSAVGSRFNYSYNKWTGLGGSATTGMMDSLNANKNPIYKMGITDAGLFTAAAKTGKTIINGYDLIFRQSGDNYILSSVEKNGRKTLSGLETMRAETSGNGIIYSNDFWPIESETHKGIDSKLGGADGKNHNMFFGMRYGFKFTLGDYTGPLTFYFRGDDDFWFFVDGELKLDLGGIHDPIGKTVDLYSVLRDAHGELDREEEHEITILYAERGSYASTCYMEFTIPNLERVPDIPVEDPAELTIIKHWVDNGTSFRPNVQIQIDFRRKGSEDDWEKYLEQPVVVTGDQNSADWSKTITVHRDLFDYKITELQPTAESGYQVTYKDGGLALMNGDGSQYTAELTNQLLVMKLPETGGRGTTPFRAAGAAMLLLACGGWMSACQPGRKFKSKEEREELR